MSLLSDPTVLKYCSYGVSLLLAALGVVGVYLTWAKDRVDDADRQRDKATIALAQRDVALAQKEIASLQSQTESARREAELARLGQRELQAKAEELKLEQEKFKHHSLQLALQLESERRERKELELEVSARVLLPNGLRQRMSHHSGTRVLVEYTAADDSETRGLAHAIAAGLSWAGWKSPKDWSLPDWADDHNPVQARPISKYKELLDTFDSGVTVGVPSGSPAGEELYRAFRDEFKLETRRITNFWAIGVVHVIVGKKPVRVLGDPFRGLGRTELPRERDLR